MGRGVGARAREAGEAGLVTQEGFVRHDLSIARHPTGCRHLVPQRRSGVRQWERVGGEVAAARRAHRLRCRTASSWGRAAAGAAAGAGAGEGVGAAVIVVVVGVAPALAPVLAPALAPASVRRSRSGGHGGGGGGGGRAARSSVGTEDADPSGALAPALAPAAASDAAAVVGGTASVPLGARCPSSHRWRPGGPSARPAGASLGAVVARSADAGGGAAGAGGAGACPCRMRRNSARMSMACPSRGRMLENLALLCTYGICNGVPRTDRGWILTACPADFLQRGRMWPAAGGRRL